MYKEVLSVDMSVERESEEVFKDNFNAILVRVEDKDGSLISSLSDLEDIKLNAILRSDDDIYLLEEISISSIMLLSDYLGGYSFSSDDDVYCGVLPFGSVFLSEDLSFQVRLKNSSDLGEDVQVDIYTVGNNMSDTRLQRYKQINGPRQRSLSECIGLYALEEFDECIVNYETNNDIVDYNMAQTFGLGSGDMQTLEDFGVVWEDESAGDYGQNVDVTFPEGLFVSCQRVYNVRYNRRAERNLKKVDDDVMTALVSSNRDARDIL